MEVVQLGKSNFIPFLQVSDIYAYIFTGLECVVCLSQLLMLEQQLIIVRTFKIHLILLRTEVPLQYRIQFQNVKMVCLN